MATTSCYRYDWYFADGLPPGTNYYGYIQWQSPPVRSAAATSTITAVPSNSTDRLTILDTSINGVGLFMTVEFTMQNTGLYTVRNWTIFMSVVEP
jgi:hypothetical protein